MTGFAGITTGKRSNAMKNILGIYSNPHGHWVGDGFPVRSLFSYDTLGAQLNAGTPTTTSYTIAGFPPSKPVNLLVWNANADGLVSPRQKVTADSNGVVNVTIAQHSVFVLTTVRLG
jgi:hypothetical protein